MIEKPTGRRHGRADLDVFVNKIIGDEPHLARVRDISASGVYLYKLLEPTCGADSQVGLEILLPSSPSVIWAVGRVVRNENSALAEGVAIRFTRIAESDRQLIRDYVAARGGSSDLECLVDASLSLRHEAEMIDEDAIVGEVAA